MTSNGLFVCYRREDACHFAGRVGDHLKQQFGSDLTFIDVDAIPLGRNFVKVLDEEVSKCDALLAIIGPNWLDAKDEQGNRRLDDEGDFVRIEIGTALRRDIPVIPILFDGAKIPRRDLLPDDLRELAVRSGIEVRHASFEGDMGRLVRDLRRVLNSGTVTPAQVVRTSPIANPTVGQSAPIEPAAVLEAKETPSEVESKVIDPASRAATGLNLNDGLRTELIAAIVGTITAPIVTAILFSFGISTLNRIINNYDRFDFRTSYIFTMSASIVLVAILFYIFLRKTGSNLRNCNGYVAYSFASSVSLLLVKLGLFIMSFYEAYFYFLALILFSSSLLFAFRRRQSGAAD